MPGRTAAQPHRRPTRAALAAGLVAALCALLVGTAGAQPEPKKPDTTTGTPVPAPGRDEAGDGRFLLPPGEPPRPSVAVQYRIPKRDRRIFAEIKDGTPVPLDEEPNRDEYDAWNEVVLFAHQKKAADLDQAAGRDLTVGDLKHPDRRYFRLDLTRFEGKLTTVAAVRPTKALAEAGVTVLYQGWLTPVDEPPANRVWVVFTELPADLPKPQLPEGKNFGPPVTVDRWAAFAGYFFKLAAYPGPEAEDPNKLSRGWLEAPLLVGKAPALLAEVPGRNIMPDKGLRIYQMIQDGPIATEEKNWAEHAAWNRLILHARKFPAEELENRARADVGFAALFQDSRRDYKLDLVKFEGHLRMLRRQEPGKRMKEAGVPATYEGWLIPLGGHTVNPVCIVFSELPPGLSVPAKAHEINRFVSFAGYSFKLLTYESQEENTDRPGTNKFRRAPLLIGHTVTLRPDPDGRETLSWATFVGGTLALVVTVLLVAFGLNWWFRRGDRSARREVENVRGRNPFGDAAEETT